MSDAERYVKMVDDYAHDQVVKNAEIKRYGYAFETIPPEWTFDQEVLLAHDFIKHVMFRSRIALRSSDFIPLEVSMYGCMTPGSVFIFTRAHRLHPNDPAIYDIDFKCRPSQLVIARILLNDDGRFAEVPLSSAGATGN